MDRETLLAKLRAERDFAAAHGQNAEALILNDRIKALSDESPSSLAVERAMQAFESALARRAAYSPAAKN